MKQLPSISSECCQIGAAVDSSDLQKVTTELKLINKSTNLNLKNLGEDAELLKKISGTCKCIDTGAGNGHGFSYVLETMIAQYSAWEKAYKAEKCTEWNNKYNALPDDCNRHSIT